jgi:hypothetical protein
MVNIGWRYEPILSGVPSISEVKRMFQQRGSGGSSFASNRHDIRDVSAKSCYHFEGMSQLTVVGSCEAVMKLRSTDWATDTNSVRVVVQAP